MSIIYRIHLFFCQQVIVFLLNKPETPDVINLFAIVSSRYSIKRAPHWDVTKKTEMVLYLTQDWNTPAFFESQQ